MLYRNNSYFIPTYIGTIPTSSHKSVIAAGENICQREIKYEMFFICLGYGRGFYNLVKFGGCEDIQITVQHI